MTADKKESTRRGRPPASERDRLVHQAQVRFNNLQWNYTWFLAIRWGCNFAEVLRRLVEAELDRDDEAWVYAEPDIDPETGEEFFTDEPIGTFRELMADRPWAPEEIAKFVERVGVDSGDSDKPPEPEPAEIWTDGEGL